MHLIEIKEKLRVSYKELEEFATRAGHKYSHQSIYRFVMGLSSPAPDGVRAVESAFLTAAEYQPKLIQEINAYFKKYRTKRGDGNDA